VSTEQRTARVVAITGASSGIGQATARALVIAFAISRPRRMTLNEILVRPTAHAR
jgi:NADP-dependent 3-hydroxy acid dehydrogenase YdfG